MKLPKPKSRLVHRYVAEYRRARNVNPQKRAALQVEDRRTNVCLCCYTVMNKEAEFVGLTANQGPEAEPKLVRWKLGWFASTTARIAECERWVKPST